MKANDWPPTSLAIWAQAYWRRRLAMMNSRSFSALPMPKQCTRSSWLVRGSGLFAQPSEHRVSGIDGWFGAAGQRPARWKQAVAIWLAFFPVSLLFNFLLGPLLNELHLLPRVMISTLILTPLMVFWFIPLSTHLLASWLTPPPAPGPATPEPVRSN
jgi:hypothetical protein